MTLCFASTRFRTAPPGPPARSIRASLVVVLSTLASICLSDFALGKDLDDGDAAKATSSWPNIYLDLRTNYATLPANTLSIGFGNSSLSSEVAALQSLPTLPNSPTLSSPASQNVAIDVPLTVDITDRVSVYGGFSANTFQSGSSDWTTLAVSSWNVGFQAASTSKMADPSRR
jgi:hypothetical protein